MLLLEAPRYHEPANQVVNGPPDPDKEGAMLYRTYRYSQWDGSQQIFELDADKLMDLLSEDILNQGDVMQALRDLMRRGIQDPDGRQMPGLRDLMEQLKNQRRQQLQQHNMDSVVDDLKERLEDIVRTERDGIQRRLDEALEQVEANHGEDRAQQEGLYSLLEKRAEHNRERLDNLPEGIGGQLKELMEYDFMDPEAQQKFQELLDMLKSQMAQNMGQQMMDQVKGMSEEDMAATREMMRQLNQMLRDKMSGQEPDFDGFMQQFGQMFGDNPPQSFDELMERLQQQLAQMQSMLDSMSPEARREMEDALAQALDPETQREMAQFAALMEQLMPMNDLRRQYPFLGDDSMTMEQAMEMMRGLQELDQLEQSLQQAISSGNLDDIDPDKLAELLGDEARRTYDELDRLRKLLQDAGYVTNDDKMDLTARGIRRIGQKALKEVFAHLKKDRDRQPPDAHPRGQRRRIRRHQDIRVRRPIPGGPAGHGEERCASGRTAGPGATQPRGLRGLPQRAHDQDRHRPFIGPEPVHGSVQQLAGGQEGHLGSDGPDAQPIPQGHPPHHRVLRLCPRDKRGRPGQMHLELLGLGHQPAPRFDAFPETSVQREGRPPGRYW